MTTAIESRIERLVSVSRAVLDRLERGDKLSAVLPQARAVANLQGDGARVHWLDCEIYGMAHVPFAKRPRRTEDEKAGAYLFCELRRAADIRKLTVTGVLAGWPVDQDPDRSMVVHQGVAHLERAVDEYGDLSPQEAFAPATDRDLQIDAMRNEHQRILDGVRAYVYQYTDKIWSWALQERENLRLLGPDYRIVIDSLDALETGVGQELVAALANLGSDNPANWCAAGLLCRNVVMKLGRTLWQVPDETWDSQLHGRTLQIKGDKELNRLRAWLDYHHQRLDPASKDRFHELDDLATRIYQGGSKGKRALRHSEAQQLVVDTFQLVKALDDLTSLEPVTEV